MDNKTVIIILSIIVVVLSVCVGFIFLNHMNNPEIEYENYTVNGTGTTVEIPVNSKIVETEDLINITNDYVYVMIYKNINESKTASMAANADIMDEKLNKETKELIQAFSYDDDDVRNHVMNSIKFGKAIKTDENKTTEVLATQTDHSNDPVYCSICGAYVATQYEIDHAKGAGYGVNPSTGKIICFDCAGDLMEAESNYDDYEVGEQDDGSYIDADGNYWSSYDEYLYTNNNL